MFAKLRQRWDSIVNPAIDHAGVDSDWWPPNRLMIAVQLGISEEDVDKAATSGYFDPRNPADVIVQEMRLRQASRSPSTDL